MLGVYGSWIGFVLCCLCIIATIYTACNPGNQFDAAAFFQETLALPIVVFCYALWKIWKRPSIVKASEADLVSGRRELDLRGEKERERLERQTWGPIKRYIQLISHTDDRVYRFIC